MILNGLDFQLFSGTCLVIYLLSKTGTRGGNRPGILSAVAKSAQPVLLVHRLVVRFSEGF